MEGFTGADTLVLFIHRPEPIHLLDRLIKSRTDLLSPRSAATLGRARRLESVDGIEVPMVGQEIKINGVARGQGLQGANEKAGCVPAVASNRIKQVDRKSTRLNSSHANISY